LEGFIETLLDYLPEACVTLLVREGYDQLAELFPQRLIWKSIRINPYIRAYGRGEIISLLAELSAGSYDLLLATRYDRTWLDDLIAAKLTSAWRVAIGDVEHVPDYYLEVLEDLGLESPLCPYDQVIPIEEKTHEPSKYQVFWERLIGKEKPLFPSELKVSEDILKIAEDVLETLHLKEGSFFLCCPAGTANISHKKWPEDNFAAVIASLENKFGLRALVVGHEAELEIMNKVISLARQKGAQPKLWSGKDGDIPLVCALAKKSVFYLGNDTGLMHMTAALRKPVLAIFGGGHWPRFLPQSQVGLIFVSPMPCFYCTWKCLFSKPHCMYYPSVDKIIDEIELAVGQILQGTGDFKVVEIEPSYRQHLILLEDALDQVKISRHLFTETDARLAERLEEIEAYERQLKQMRTLLEESNAEREARLKIIERQQEEFTKKIQEIEADRAARLELISDLGRKLEESETDRRARLELISRLGRKLEESETDREARLSLVKELSGRIDESERDRAARLELIEELGRKLEESETDRAARLEVITNLETTLQESERNAEEVLHKLPLVSIVTPVFNAEKWIERCINSILSQDYPRIEHIIVDGGSKDNTLKICGRYKHLVVHSRPDRGQSDAINKGFSIATGEILAWLCADDEYEPNAVSVAVQELQKGAQFVMGNSRFIDADGKFISDHPANQYPFYDHTMLIRFWKFTPISQPATFWQRGLWEASGPLRENLYFAMDYDLWLRMSQRTKFARVPTFLAKYRIHPEAKCFSDNYGSRIELIQVSRKYWPVKWSPRYWIYFFQYLMTASNITKHYADAEKLLNNCVGHLDNGKRLRAMGSFFMAHIKHFATPLLPDYRLVLNRMIKKGIGLQWFWRFTHKISSILFPKKELILVLTHKKEKNEDFIILKADSRGYKQPQFRFWGNKGGNNDFVLLRDWETENTFVLRGASKNFGGYGVHVRTGEDEDFADQAWVKHLSESDLTEG
jgi:glycosyltransferase involved in cell wall biosynthesis/ADP-heptose:LPS heptosyltransferase